MSNSFSLKNLLKRFDFFGVHFNFNYGSETNYHSSAGGLGFLLFLIVSIIYFTFNFISFVKRDIFTLIHYTTNLSEPHQVSMSAFSSTLALGITCDYLENFNDIYDLVDLELFHVTLKRENGSFSKVKTPIEVEKCSSNSFYNQFNDSLSKYSLETFFCPKNLDSLIQGKYTDENFKYYEFIFKEKDSNPTTKKIVNSILSNTECILSTYFIDIQIDIDNFHNPIGRFINSKHTILRPDSIMKLNLYYKLISFSSDSSLLFEHSNSKYYLGHSHLDESSVYKGTANGEENSEKEIISEVYIRLDDSKTIIQRRYMKLNEFSANFTSIISNLFVAFFLILRSFNFFFANKSLVNRILRYKEEATFRKEESSEISFERKKFLWDTKKKKVGLSREEKSKMMFENCQKNPSFYMQEQTGVRLSPSRNKGRIPEGSNTVHMIKTKDNAPLSGLRSHNLSPSERYLRLMQKKKNYFRFSALELICIFFLPCIKQQKLKKKIDFFGTCCSMLSKKLDVMNYLRNLQIIDFLTEILLDNDEKVLIDFLSNPSMSLANQIYGNPQRFQIDRFEIEEFYSSFLALTSKLNRGDKEEKIVDLANFHLKSLFGDFGFQKLLSSNANISPSI